MPSDTLPYPNNIKATIKRLGYTVGEVAEEVGIPSRTMTSYLKGSTAIPRDQLEKIAEILGCSTEELRGEPQTKNRHPAESINVYIKSEEQVKHYHAIDALGETIDAFPPEEHLGAFLALSTHDLAPLLDIGWSIESLLNLLKILLQGVQAMPVDSRRISRRKLLELTAALAVSGISLLTREHVSFEERSKLSGALGENIAAGWKLFSTASMAQIAAISQAQLHLVQQAHSIVYPNVLPVLYSGVYRLKGAALFFQDRYEDAHHALQSAYIAALEGADSWNMAQSLTWQVYEYQARCQYTQANQTLEKALRLIAHETDEAYLRLRSHLLACWAKNASMMKEWKVVEEKLEASASFLDQIRPNEEFDRTHWFHCAGNCALTRMNYNEASIHYERALAEMPAEWTMRQAVTLVALATARAREHNLDTSLATAKKVIPLLGVLNSPLLNKQFGEYVQKDLLPISPFDSRIHKFITDTKKHVPQVVS